MDQKPWPSKEAFIRCCWTGWWMDTAKKILSARYFRYSIIHVHHSTALTYNTGDENTAQSKQCKASSVKPSLFLDPSVASDFSSFLSFLCLAGEEVDAETVDLLLPCSAPLLMPHSTYWRSWRISGATPSSRLMLASIRNGNIAVTNYTASKVNWNNLCKNIIALSTIYSFLFCNLSQQKSSNITF